MQQQTKVIKEAIISIINMLDLLWPTDQSNGEHVIIVTIRESEDTHKHTHAVLMLGHAMITTINHRVRRPASKAAYIFAIMHTRGAHTHAQKDL